MERLTQKAKDPLSKSYFAKGTNLTSGIICKLGAYEDIGFEPNEIMDNMQMFAAYRHVCGGLPPEKVSALVNAEEHGLLVRLPCKVGDTVYEVNLPDELAEVCVYEVQDISTKEIMFCDDWCSLSALGKTVFLTREAAEQALRERGE